MNCVYSIKSANLDNIEVVSLLAGNSINFDKALFLAKEEAKQRFEEYLLISWYDRDRNFESPPHTTEKSGDGPKDGYIHYGINHGAKLKVDIDNGRFVFFFTPVSW